MPEEAAELGVVLPPQGAEHGGGGFDEVLLEEAGCLGWGGHISCARVVAAAAPVDAVRPPGAGKAACRRVAHLRREQRLLGAVKPGRYVPDAQFGMVGVAD